MLVVVSASQSDVLRFQKGDGGGETRHQKNEKSHGKNEQKGKLSRERSVVANDGTRLQADQRNGGQIIGKNIIIIKIKHGEGIPKKPQLKAMASIQKRYQATILRPSVKNYGTVKALIKKHWDNTSKYQ